MKYFAVINTDWQKDEWNEPFYEQMMAIRGEQIFGLAIFNSKKEAQKFKNVSKRRKNKIVKIILAQDAINER